jgi:tetratricopeptide (TPR) repeat protein
MRYVKRAGSILRSFFSNHPSRAVSARNFIARVTGQTVLKHLMRGLICTMMLSGGCTPEQGDKDNLTAGYAALDARQYDDAISHADAQLIKSQEGEGSAEAFYLKGRAYEQRAKPDVRGANSDLDTAASYYSQALTMSPARSLEGYIHASLGNVYYWRDNYSAALQQLSVAYDLVDSPDLKSFILYRAGLCEQRMGQFTVADKSFDAVQQRFPGSEAAARARDHEGFRSFNVRVATFSTAQAAELALQSLRGTGVGDVQRKDLSNGRSILLVGPEGTYTEALGMKIRVAGQYPDSVIVP